MRCQRLTVHTWQSDRGEGAILAIQDATRLSDILSKLSTDTIQGLRVELDEFQKACVAKGSEAVALARESMAKAQAGENPSFWGYQSWPMEDIPVKLENLTGSS